MGKLLFCLLLAVVCRAQDEVLDEATRQASDQAVPGGVHPPLIPAKEEKPKEIVKLEPEGGPTRFYYEKENMPKFLMHVEEGIIVTVYEDGKEWDSFLLDKEAAGGIFGSKIHTEGVEFQVDINWKKQSFSGMNNPNNKIEGIQLEMLFNISRGSFELIDFQIVGLKGRYNVDLDTISGHGYPVKAPIGLAFGCHKAGMFKPKGNESMTGTSAGITLPGVRLQVYEVHRGRLGPIWECGIMIPIGLWVGILVSLFLGTIVTYGFCMLANINTMDRFDDPRGNKCIYVPNTD